jgi:hypothetical protein
LPIFLAIYSSSILFPFWLLLNDLIQVCVSCLLLHWIVYIMPYSFSVSFMGYVNIQLVKYLIAANLCPRGWHDLFGIMMYVAVGFLYTANFILVSSFAIVISKKLILFSDPSSMVNYIKVLKLLKLFKTSCLLDVLERQTIRISSTYLWYIITLYVNTTLKYLYFQSFVNIFPKRWQGLLPECTDIFVLKIIFLPQNSTVLYILLASFFKRTILLHTDLMISNHSLTGTFD